MLILTDGDIHDLRKTVDAIVELSKFPVSLIIVGIGEENFGTLEFLDSDDRLLKDGKNNEAKRDIV